MTVETPERDWTDSRLDDLKQAVDGGHKEMKAGFAKVDADIRDVRSDMAAGFAKVDERFEKVDERFEKVDKEMKAGFAKVDADIRDVRSDVAAGFIRLDDKFDKKFDRLLFWLLAGMGTIIVTFVVGIVRSF